MQLINSTKETIGEFLETIPAGLRRTLKKVSTDRWAGYVNAAEEFAAVHDAVAIEVVGDRFHVAKNYRECVDQVRKKEGRRLRAELPETEYEETLEFQINFL